MISKSNRRFSNSKDDRDRLNRWRDEDEDIFDEEEGLLEYSDLEYRLVQIEDMLESIKGLLKKVISRQEKQFEETEEIKEELSEIEDTIEYIADVLDSVETIKQDIEDEEGEFLYDDSYFDNEEEAISGKPEPKTNPSKNPIQKLKNILYADGVVYDMGEEGEEEVVEEVEGEEEAMNVEEMDMENIPVSQQNETGNNSNNVSVNNVNEEVKTSGYNEKQS